MSISIGLPPLPSLSLPIPIPSITPPPEPSDPPPEPSGPSSEPSTGPSSGGPSSGGPSSGGPSSGGPSNGGPSSSGGGGSSSAEPSSSSAQSSSESTITQDTTSVFESLSVITSNGETITTNVLVTQTIESGTVVTNVAQTGGASANVGAIVGGVVGGLLGLLAIGGLIFFLLKRRKRNFDKEFDGNFDPDYVSKHNTTAFTSGAALGLGGATGAAATGSHRKSHSLEKAGKQRVNLNGVDRASLEAAALAEDDGMGGRLDASTVGGGIVTPFPYPQNQAQGGYGHQTPYNPAMSPPPMSPPPGNMALGAMGAAGAAGYYAGHHNQHHPQQPYVYGQQPYGQGYPDRHGAISPSSTDGGMHPNPYLTGAAASSQGHGNAYGGFADPSNQSVYGGVAPSMTGTSVSGYPHQGGIGTFGGAGAAMSSAASTHSSAGTGGPAGALSYTTGSGAMSAKEREARGMRPLGGMAVANPDERPENRRADGSAGSVLPSPFDAALGGGASSSGAAAPTATSGKAAEANANANRQSGLIVHQDGGRVREDEDDAAPGEIPPAYDSLLYDGRK